jgi:hypothetical protein
MIYSLAGMFANRHLPVRCAGIKRAFWVPPKSRRRAFSPNGFSTVAARLSDSFHSRKEGRKIFFKNFLEISATYYYFESSYSNWYMEYLYPVVRGEKSKEQAR